MSVGHNSGAVLKSFIDRIENLEEEKKGLADDIKEVKAEAKGQGFDLKVLNAVLKRRRMDPDDRMDFDDTVATYEDALAKVIEDFVKG